MTEKDSSTKSGSNPGEEEIVPKPITALRMLRSLLPLDDAKMGLDSPEGLQENREEAKKLLLWPPNLFAFTSEMLRSTGTYYLVVSPARDEADIKGDRSEIEIRKEIWPPQEFDREEDGKRKNIWGEEVRRLGFRWRKKLNKHTKEFFRTRLRPDEVFREGELDDLLSELVPREVLQWWNKLAEGFDTENIKDLECVMENAEIRTLHWQAFKMLMSLHAVADEACLGWGIREYISDEPLKETRKSDAQTFAEGELARRGTLATIHEDRCRILPKRHSPNVGMTLRSISSNLAFYHRSSVEVKWRPAVETHLTQLGPQMSSLHVLLLPWPYNLRAREFVELTAPPYQANTPEEAFFHYRPERHSDDEVRDNDEPRDETHFIDKVLPDLLAKANDEGGRIDLVILPEMAISEDNIDWFENQLKHAKVSGYIAGVRSEAHKRSQRFNRNMLYCKFSSRSGADEHFDFPRDSDDYIQQKHHRWKLDRFQLIKYKLGGSLSTNKVWWEGIKLSRRKVTFVNVGEQITICPLICEDLARQEPISDLIRAVGPTLVVAILMDGPQQWHRWSAGYASVLADDPRSSVLTFTCLGMVERMKTPDTRPSRAIALWKDSLNAPTEIELEDNKKGIVLYLNVEQKKEITADGREELVATPYLTLGGTVCI